MSVGAALGAEEQLPGVGQLAVPAGRRQDRVRFQLNSIPLLLPAVLLLVLLFLGPVIYSFYLGFTNLDLIGPTSLHWHFTGLANVKQLGHDTVFHQSLYLTAYFVLGSGVVGATGVGLILALAMERAIGGIRILISAIVILCFTLPPITVAMVWYAAST